MRALFAAALLALASPLAAQGRQNLMEWLAAALDNDRGFSAREREDIREALKERFADYALKVVRPGQDDGAKVVMRMVIEGHFDQAPPQRIAEVAFAAFQAISRGAPADVVEGIALYGYRKKISGERIATWANGYRQMTDAKVPPEVAADLVRNAMEQNWDDGVFNTLKWGLVRGAQDSNDMRAYATWIFGHMLKGGKGPGALAGEARSYFKKLKKTAAAPVLPPYEGVFSRKPFPEAVYEPKAAAPAPSAKAPSQDAMDGALAPRADAPPLEEPARAALSLRMRELWPGLEASSKSYLGTPYVWGGTTRRGIDCSALMQNSYGENRVKLPRVSRQQYQIGDNVDAAPLKEGDLVFFNTMGVGVSHVGMVVDPEGPRFIHASSSRGVVIDSMAKSYFKTRYLGARRIVR